MPAQNTSSSQNAPANPPSRGQKRDAKNALEQTRRLLQRAGTRLPSDLIDQFDAAIYRVQNQLDESDNSTELESALQTLDKLADKHLRPYQKSGFRETIESLAWAFLIAIILRVFLVEPFKIPSGSVIPTLEIGDQLFVNKILYGVRVPLTSIRLVDFAAPKRGEVVVFIYPFEPHEDYIKRVIGLPGDTIAVRDGVIYLNDKPVNRQRIGVQSFWDRMGENGPWREFQAMVYEESLGEHTYRVLEDLRRRSELTNFSKTVVPDGHVFVMGDNRDHSSDSREWGMVPSNNILGRASIVWWSWGRDGLDYSRIGTWID